MMRNLIHYTSSWGTYHTTTFVVRGHKQSILEQNCQQVRPTDTQQQQIIISAQTQSHAMLYQKQIEHAREVGRCVTTIEHLSLCHTNINGITCQLFSNPAYCFYLFWRGGVQVLIRRVKHPQSPL